jgi:L-alanine-DL-glutamate epimerase-like enolase superfamily enzyme
LNPTSIKAVNFFRATSTKSVPIQDATHNISEISFIVTRITLASGVTGDAYLLSFHFNRNAAIGALRDVSELALGRDVSRRGEFVRHARREAEYFGHAGLNQWACCSLDIAMWDAWAKTIGQPVWKLFGAYRSKVPLYGSGGWLSYSIPELLEEVTAYVKRGFRAVKIKVGSPEVTTDYERLVRVREAVGHDIKIMMDANQGMDVPSALSLARMARTLQITWFEEPLPHTDFDGYMHLRQHAGISLAMGEREFDTVALRELIRRNALDLWQPDLLRLGSVEAWRDSAALAAAHDIPVLPHYYKEYDVPLLMTVPNAYGSESFDWVDDLITNPIRMEDGFAFANEEPGWGFPFRQVPDSLPHLIRRLSHNFQKSSRSSISGRLHETMHGILLLKRVSPDACT